MSPAGPARLTRQQREDLIAAAKPWYDAGCAVHLAKPDGSKTPKSVRHGSLRVEPDVFPAKLRNGQPHPRAGQPNPAAGQFGWGWKRIASGDLPPMSWEQIASGIRRGDADGIGIICGAVSGGLEMVEVEGRARDLLPAIRAAAERLGHADLLARLESGCAEESPSGGLHYVLRVIDGAPLGNVELASRPDPAAEHGQRVLCETRGQGGWFVSAPSAGRTHGTGKSYRLVSGSPATIPAFTTAERDAIYDCFRAVDEMPARPARPVAAAGESTAARRERPDGEILPGDDFDQRASWADAIPPTWVRLCEGPTADEWSMYADGKRKTADHYHDKDRFYIYDTDCPGSKRLLSKFGLYAWLNHNGDFAAAARDLWRKGYGSRHDDRDGGDDEDGGTPVPVEPRPMPAGECRTLDDWRAETAARLADAVGRGGVISLDTGPTGAGKSHNTTAALRLASSSLTVLPTHSGVVERVQEMQAAGIDAVAYPELNADTCQQYDVASRAQSLGLAAGAAVCPGCPFNRIPNPRYPGRDADGEPEPKQIPGPCHAPSQYQGMMRAATAASHRVATHERLRRSSRAAEGVKVVVVDETPEQVLAPTLTVSVRQIVPVEGLAHGILNHWYSRATPEQKSFARAMNAVMAGIHATCAAVTAAGHREVDLNLPHDVPDRWQRLLFDHIRMSGGAADMDADALTLVTRAAAGELESLTVVTDMTPAGDLHHYVVGAWRPEIPADAAVIALDATGNADDLTAVADRPVVDCTPSGHLPLHHPVVQIPDDISMGTSAVVVAGMVEAFLASRPDVQRLGMMGHS
ncbi:MAG: hypothetical protein EBZ59_10170, partial [Planctomycetia bacterium]|nr:hypothetical protein [Planctomycetia bacterium]